MKISNLILYGVFMNYYEGLNPDERDQVKYSLTNLIEDPWSVLSFISQPDDYPELFEIRWEVKENQFIHLLAFYTRSLAWVIATGTCSADGKIASAKYDEAMEIRKFYLDTF
ncbi:MAG: hypothetical protein R3C61_25495 [Bacteroidia bacterium]